jgi:hypothetical protein
LTALGEEKYLAALPISDVDREAFSVLSREEQMTLIDLLSRIQERVQHLLHESSPLGSSEVSASTTIG